jgi:hypothetical protein
MTQMLSVLGFEVESKATKYHLENNPHFNFYFYILFHLFLINFYHFSVPYKQVPHSCNLININIVKLNNISNETLVTYPTVCPIKKSY